MVTQIFDPKPEGRPVGIDLRLKRELAVQRPCNLAVFFGKLPSMGAELDDKLPSNSS